jgi:hypothetical protein
VSDEVVRRLREPGATFEDVADLVRGREGRGMLKSGDMSKGIFWAGMIQGLIHDIPSLPGTDRHGDRHRRCRGRAADIAVRGDVRGVVGPSGRRNRRRRPLRARGGGAAPG